jgi:hypothetical protein
MRFCTELHAFPYPEEEQSSYRERNTHGNDHDTLSRRRLPHVAKRERTRASLTDY